MKKDIKYYRVMRSISVYVVKLDYWVKRKNNNTDNGLKADNYLSCLLMEIDKIKGYDDYDIIMNMFKDFIVERKLK